MVTKNLSNGCTIVSITYGVEGWEGTVHNVSVDPVDQSMRCTCREGWRGENCQHQDTVRDGKAGKPIIRGHQLPPFTRARTSAGTRDLQDSLDV